MSELHPSKKRKTNEPQVGDRPILEKNENQTAGTKNDEGKESVERKNEQVNDENECITKSTNVSETIQNPSAQSDSDGNSRKREFVTHKYNSIMSNRLPLMKELISLNSISTALLSSYAAQIYEMSVVEDMAISNIVQLIEMFFCSKRSVKGKRFFSTENGRVISTFRARCLKNCVLHLSRGYNNLVLSQSFEMETRSGLPAWVKSIVPKKSIIDIIKKAEEEAGSSADYSRRRKEIVRGVKVNVDDDSLFVMHHMYTTVVNSLNKNRKQVRRLFTRNVGFLLKDWSEVGFSKVEQRTEIVWLRPCKNSNLSFPGTVEENKTLLCEGDIERQNEELLFKFISEHDEMIAYITYPVVCWNKKSAQLRKSSGTDITAVENIPTEKIIRRKISLIELSLMMLRDMTGYEEQKSLSEVLKYNRKTMAAAYSLAVCLRTIINGHKSKTKVREMLDTEVEIGKTELAKDGSSNEDIDTIWTINGIEDQHEIIERALESLLCGTGETQRYLETEIMRQTIDWYNKNHIPFTHDTGFSSNFDDNTGLRLAEVLEESKKQDDFEVDM